MDRFTDAAGARVSPGRANRSAVGAGAAAETRLTPNGGKVELSLRGALGLERTLRGETSLDVSGESLNSIGPRTRLLLGLAGTWRTGRFLLHAAIQARGPLSGDTAVTGRLALRMAF